MIYLYALFFLSSSIKNPNSVPFGIVQSTMSKLDGGHFNACYRSEFFFTPQLSFIEANRNAELKSKASKLLSSYNWRDWTCLFFWEFGACGARGICWFVRSLTQYENGEEFNLTELMLIGRFYFKCSDGIRSCFLEKNEKKAD